MSSDPPLDSPHWVDRETLLEATEKLANVGSWQWDVLNNQVDWSPQLKRILGYPQDIVPSQELWFARICPDDLERLTQGRNQFTKGGMVAHEEFRIHRPSGEVRTVKMSTSSGVREDGKVIYARGLLMDITEQRQLEQQLRHSHKMRAIGRLAGGVAHDFNNLLTVIRAHSERLQKGNRVPEASHNSLMAIDQAVDLAAELTKRLLTFGRKDPAEKQIVDVNASLNGAATLIRRVIGSRVEVLLDLGDNLPSVELDEGQLQHAMMNLAANARDAMPQGGSLTIRTQRGGSLFPEQSESDVEESVLISVSDSGLGMTEEVQARALDPFFTTKAPGEGTGLGLSGVYVFTTESGGRMQMISAPDQGTQVILQFPGTNKAGIPASQNINRKPSRSLCICVVEDNEDVLKPLAVSLREAGHHVSAHLCPVDALEKIIEAQGQCEVLLTDLMMAKMSGQELVERARKVYPNLPVVMMTGFSSEAGPELNEQTRLLRKPFGINDLLDAITRAVEPLG